MILRQWRGWTTPQNAEAYEGIVKEVLASIATRELAGYHGAYLLRRELGDEVEFATNLIFDSTKKSPRRPTRRRPAASGARRPQPGPSRRRRPGR
jgi:hypothetical protein